MKTCTLFCCALLAAVAMQAQIIHVPGDYPTIQQGIDSAHSGDIVLVEDSTYYEQINFHGKKITVASHFLLDGDTSHISKTIIDGGHITDLDSASVVYFISGEDTASILCGFTIRNGKGTLTTDMGYNAREGGGIFISLSGAKVINNHITENHLSDTIFGSVDVVDGAGIYTEWLQSNNWVVVDHNVIDYNSCYCSSIESSCAGMGISNNARVTNNTISDNFVEAVSGCVAVGAGFAIATNIDWNNPATVIVQNNIIKSNVAETENNFTAGAGGYLRAVNGIVSGNIITENVIKGGYLFSGGGAGIFMVAPGEGFIFRDNIFSKDTSQAFYASLAIIGASGDSVQSPVLVENNYFIDNEARNGGGFTSLNNPAILQNNVFSGNHATFNGGGVYLEGGGLTDIHHKVKMINNSFYGNIADNHGGAIHALGLDDLLVINSVFWNDTCIGGAGQEIYCYNGLTDSVELSNCDINLNYIYGTVVVGGLIITEDPLYQDTTLLITSESPCFNNGIGEYVCTCGDTHLSPAYDITEMPRPQYGLYDIGAFEGLHVGIFGSPLGSSTMKCRSFPNPFVSTTTFSYTLTEPSRVSLKIFDGFGRMVAEPACSYQQKGEHKVMWDAIDLPCGMYYFRILAGGKTGSGKLIKQ